MNSKTVKQLSYVAFIAGIVSVLGSAMIYFRGEKDRQEENRQTGLFVGLWAPTLFAISEMLDRLSVEDDSYMGVKIKHPIGERVGALSGR